jgi:hypothetical protein
MSDIFLVDTTSRPLDPVHPGYARLLLTRGNAVRQGWRQRKTCSRKPRCVNRRRRESWLTPLLERRVWNVVPWV